jgi:hypothetical protein
VTWAGTPADRIEALADLELEFPLPGSTSPQAAHAHGADARDVLTELVCAGRILNSTAGYHFV